MIQAWGNPVCHAHPIATLSPHPAPNCILTIYGGSINDGFCFVTNLRPLHHAEKGNLKHDGLRGLPGAQLAICKKRGGAMETAEWGPQEFFLNRTLK